MNAMAASLDESGLVDVAENHPAKDGSVLVGIPRERDNSQGEASVIFGVGIGQGLEQ